MGYDNNKLNTFYDVGKITEGKFAMDLLSSMGGDVIPSTKSQDVNDHIDLFWLYDDNNKSVSFDVKGVRKTSRADKMPTFDYTWLEMQNVNGKEGSLYGKETYIAFEGPSEWHIVRRKELAEATEKSIKDEIIYTERPEECFKKYQRKGRKDIIIKVPFSFIQENTVKKIPKII